MLLAQIRNLYLEEKLSTSEVAKRLEINHWRVVSLMRKHNIPRRTPAETHRIQFLKSPLSYSKKENLSPKEKTLYLVGLMLYWAEGSKRSVHTVDFANSDEKMIRLFLTMLRKIYHVNEAKLRVLLYCYSNQNPTELIHFWSQFLNIPRPQFTKPYVRADFNAQNPRKMEYGLVHIRYADMRLLLDIKTEIDIIYSNLVKTR